MEIYFIIELGLIAASIIISSVLINRNLKKNRNLETIKYISMVRKEIWELTDFKKMEDFAKEYKENVENKQNNEKLRAVKQKLEYMAAAINNDDLSIDLLQSFSGKWFMSVTRLLKIIKKDSYQEIKKLYNKIDESYNN